MNARQTSLTGQILAAASLVLIATTLPAQALIFFGSGDSTHNTTDPGDGSGWQWQIQYENALATAIAPEFFITAKHVFQGVGGTIHYEGQAFTTVAAWSSPTSDLTILKVDHPFSSWAPLYQGSDEVGKTLTVFGRGTQRGDPVNVAGASTTTLRGWVWGTPDYQQRWGQNVVSSVEDYTGQRLGKMLSAGFDRVSTPGDPTTAGGLAEEATLSTGDSGGGVFIREGGQWKLAGINFGVVTGWRFNQNDATGFNAAIFDSGGLYLDNFGSISEVANDVPANWLSTRISDNLGWINGVIAVPEPPATAWILTLVPAIAAMATRRRKALRSTRNDSGNLLIAPEKK